MDARWGIAAVDYDNDGWMDLVAVGETFYGEGHIVLLRNEGPAGFRDVTATTGLDKIVLHNPRSVIAFDFDGDGAPDLLITQNVLPPVLLKNEGGNRFNWIRLGFKGENAINGIGTKVDIFAGALRQKWEVAGASGYLSQGPPRLSLAWARAQRGRDPAALAHRRAAGRNANPRLQGRNHHGD